MNALSDLLFERDLLTENEQSEIQQLVGERMTANERASELLERFRSRTRAKVTAEHEAAKEAVGATSKS